MAIFGTLIGMYQIRSVKWKDHLSGEATCLLQLFPFRNPLTLGMGDNGRSSHLSQGPNNGNCCDLIASPVLAYIHTLTHNFCFFHLQVTLSSLRRYTWYFIISTYMSMSIIFKHLYSINLEDHVGTGKWSIPTEIMIIFTYFNMHKQDLHMEQMTPLSETISPLLSWGANREQASKIIITLLERIRLSQCKIHWEIRNI